MRKIEVLALIATNENMKIVIKNLAKKGDLAASDIDCGEITNPTAVKYADILVDVGIVKLRVATEGRRKTVYRLDVSELERAKALIKKVENEW